MIGHPAPSRSAGFTIVELVLALAISALVLSAVPAMIALSARAAPTAGGVQNAASQAADCLAQLNADLQLAHTVTELTASSVTMSVPARDGSAGTQQIRYAWSGTPGDPITLSIDGVESRLVAGVDAFSLVAVAGVRTVYTESTLTETGSVRHQSLTGVVVPRSINNPGGLLQVVNAPTGSGLLGWTISSLSLYLSCSTPIVGESVIISIVPLNADKSPAGGAYYTTQIASTDLKASTKLYQFSTPPLWIPAGEPVGVKLTKTSASLNAAAGVCASVALYSGGALYSASADSGPWSIVGGFAMAHDASGSLLAGSGGPADRNCLQRLDVSITTGDANDVFTTSLFPLNPTLMP